jgi:hypothetical protein
MTMPKFPPVAEQMQILMRGVDFGDELTYTHMERELCQRLQESYDSGRPLKVYCGYDPSSPDLHIGHTISMRKLRQFQDLLGQQGASGGVHGRSDGGALAGRAFHGTHCAQRRNGVFFENRVSITL